MAFVDGLYFVLDVFGDGGHDWLLVVVGASMCSYNLKLI